MARRYVLAALATVAVMTVLAGPASAGGGCHDGVTSGRGTTVEIVDACFTPTTLFVEPGDRVTFVNLDPFVHNVGGNLWGHFDDLLEGDRFSASFAEEGVYSFACTYHPGMTGSIVVGDGLGAGNGETVSTSLGTPPGEPSAGVAVLGSSAGRGSSSAPWFGGAAIGLVIGFAVSAALRRRRAAFRPGTAPAVDP
jgi:plastocyanin